MPTLDKDGNVVRRDIMSRDFSSSGSESDFASSMGGSSIASSMGFTPARSRAGSRSSLGATPSRSRSSRTSAGRAPPLPRGTARVRGGGGSEASFRGRASPTSENSSEEHRGGRTGGSSGGGSSGGGKGGDVRKPNTVMKTPHARTKETGGREKLQTLGDAMSKSSPLAMNKPNARSMPNMAALLVAPLSRPIPTESVGYLYGGQQEEPRVRTPERSLSPHSHGSRSQKKSRSERQKRRSENGGGSVHSTHARKSSRPYNQSQSPGGGCDSDQDSRRGPSSPPTNGHQRPRSSSGREKEGKIVAHRRNSSGGGDSDGLSTSNRSSKSTRSRRSVPRDRSERTSSGGSTAPPLSSKGKRLSHDGASGGPESSSRHKPGRQSRKPSMEASRDGTSSDWDWMAKDLVRPTEMSPRETAAVSTGRAHEGSGGPMAAGKEDKGGNGIEGRSSPLSLAAEKTKAEREAEMSAAAANWERNAAAEAAQSVEAAAVIRARRAAEAKVAEAAVALKARQEADAKAVKAAKALEEAKAAAAAAAAAAPAAATAANAEAAAVIATAAATAAQTVAATAAATVAATTAASAASVHSGTAAATRVAARAAALEKRTEPPKPSHAVKPSSPVKHVSSPPRSSPPEQRVSSPLLLSPAQQSSLAPQSSPSRSLPTTIATVPEASLKLHKRANSGEKKDTQANRDDINIPPDAAAEDLDVGQGGWELGADVVTEMEVKKATALETAAAAVAAAKERAAKARDESDDERENRSASAEMLSESDDEELEEEELEEGEVRRPKEAWGERRESGEGYGDDNGHGQPLAMVGVLTSGQGSQHLLMHEVSWGVERDHVMGGGWSFTCVGFVMVLIFRQTCGVVLLERDTYFVVYVCS